jgi:DNA-binding MarR family transcriptional regulator
VVLVDAETVTRMRRVVSRMARQFNTDATSEGLTPSQASVLGQIVARGPLAIGELCQLEGINPTMLSRVIGKLDEAGLIRRKPNPDDLRSAWVESTRAGATLSGRIWARRTSTLSAGIARLPHEQQQALAAALPVLEALVEDLADRAP